LCAEFCQRRGIGAESLRTETVPSAASGKGRAIRVLGRGADRRWEGQVCTKFC